MILFTEELFETIKYNLAMIHIKILTNFNVISKKR